jgi:uncharacterized protein (DUF1697 family)
MPRFVAFLRGVSPVNAKMPDLKRAFESAGYTDVKTILASGNVAFNARMSNENALEKKAEKAMVATLGRTFNTIVRSTASLERLLKANPYGRFELSPDSKRVVTFLRRSPDKKISLPLEYDGVQILTVIQREVFTVYSPNPRGPVFMTLLEKTFGTEITTRTWETVKKCAAA